MFRWGMLIAILALALAQPATAAKMTEKDKCLQAVADIGDMKEDAGTPEATPKEAEAVDSLVEIATHLCTQGNFKYAEELLGIARVIMSSE